MTTRVVSKTIDLAVSSGAEEVKKYITKIDDAGIFVSPSSQRPTIGNEGDSIKIDADGLEVFRDSTSIASYGTSTRIGEETELNVGITNNNILFNKDQESLAYISSEKLFTELAEARAGYYIGKYILRETDEGHFVIGRRNA